MTSGNTTPGREQPVESTSGNTRTGRPRRTIDLPGDLAAELAAFTDRLASATDLGPATRDKYRRNTAAFLTWLAQAREADAVDGDPLTDPAARDWAVRDWRRHLKNTRTTRGTHLGAATINNRLAAVDAFFALRGSGRPQVVREHLARPSAPRALDQRTLLRFLRTVARDASPRDRAICHLAYYAGLRVAEIVALDVADVRLSARKGSVRVRVRGKDRLGGKDRTVPLHAQARASVEALLDELGRPTTGPLIRNRDGGKLSTRAANTIVSALGAAAGIGPADDGEAFGPHVLRHTFGTDLVRSRGDLTTEPVDVVLVAELMGHADLNTTRRYALPTDADKTRALEALTTDR
ncbi:tyrosine-type recombinase/integrase [Thermobifida halotolerans]|uniref:Tyrosine-type recombinase/integrase n=1 Tax=Thermobifida halotolerans TaxID=483545 RepID=A0A399FZP9_9ACTN|nr:tyrosine-type recombinase/integrase [Thermobifida halotolerans]UOE21399.1 tyrosine-type recombinase/integrase [Thermobifida halotolerans]